MFPNSCTLLGRKTGFFSYFELYSTSCLRNILLFILWNLFSLDLNSWSKHCWRKISALKWRWEFNTDLLLKNTDFVFLPETGWRAWPQMGMKLRKFRAAETLLLSPGLLRSFRVFCRFSILIGTSFPGFLFLFPVDAKKLKKKVENKLLHKLLASVLSACLQWHTCETRKKTQLLEEGLRKREWGW